MGTDDAHGSYEIIMVRLGYIEVLPRIAYTKSQNHMQLPQSVTGQSNIDYQIPQTAKLAFITIFF